LQAGTWATRPKGPSDMKPASILLLILVAAIPSRSQVEPEDDTDKRLHEITRALHLAEEQLATGDIASKRAGLDIGTALRNLERPNPSERELVRAPRALYQAKKSLCPSKSCPDDSRAQTLKTINEAMYEFERAYAPQTAKGESGSVVVKVFYATDRKQASINTVEFLNERGSEELTLGTFKVSIPRDHRLSKIERPSIWNFEIREDAAKHFVIVGRNVDTEDEFYEDVSRTVALCSEKQAFVFIHGFDVEFDDAIYRTAQIAYDLGFCGAPIVYSWPSTGRLGAYTWDLTYNDWTVPHLIGFLEDVSKRTGARTIHLIAHSMGNRALVNALNRLPDPSKPHFQQIVLTAPDIDTATFLQLSAAIRSHASRVTLYVSSKDKALQAARALDGGRRAGDSHGDIVVIDGIDTIDVSSVDTSLTGHSYYGENRSFLSDLFHLLQTGDPPRKRFGIYQTGSAPKLYWRFAP
jgi:esterase/lipase superfamily enzyme